MHQQIGKGIMFRMKIVDVFLISFHLVLLILDTTWYCFVAEMVFVAVVAIQFYFFM